MKTVTLLQLTKSFSDNHLLTELVDGLANNAPSPSSSSELNSQLNISQAVCYNRKQKPLQFPH